MELLRGRLRATLVAGKIPATEEAITLLSTGLSTVGHGYHIEKAISWAGKTDNEIKKDLSRLHAACRTVVEVLDADMRGLYQIEAMLSDPYRGSPVPQLVEQLRLLSGKITLLLAILEQNRAIKKRQQNPETWFLVAVHDLFAALTGNPEPGIAGPLHRFTHRCAGLIDPAIGVPNSENSFQKRLSAALARRTGKITVFPLTVFPGKTSSGMTPVSSGDLSDRDLPPS
jgi:hypothetical protein